MIEGNFSRFQELFQPPDPFADIYNQFHELSVRKLVKDAPARESLLDRGFTEESLIAFRYGYSNESVYKKLLEQFSKDELIEAKLWVKNDEKDYDFPYFQNHIVIPYMRGKRYVTFQGRHLDPDAKKRYLFLSKPDLYHPEDLNKRGRVWLTEGAFKRDRLVQEGEHASAIPAANHFKKHIAELNRCEDLWIVLDADANEVGQKASLELAQSLRKCTVVTLPLQPGQEKIGVDDFIEKYGIDALRNLQGVRYEAGTKARPTSLSVLVSAWKERVEKEDQSGYETGHPRLDSWLGGFHNGSLAFLAGAAHFGKTIFLEDSALRLYKRYPNLILDYYSNDDSLFTTITRLISKIGHLQPKEVRYAGKAFKDRPDDMQRFEAAVKKLSMKSDRLKILDRSYNISLEKLKDELVSWRQDNPEGEKAVFIDAFTKTMTRRDGELKDEMSRAIYKSSLLKEIAQEAHVPVICSHEVPKLNGRRPNPWNLRGSNTLEYDADVVLLFFQEAHVKGLQNTSIKIEYDNTEPNPVLEIGIGKDKIAGTKRETDLFEIDKAEFGFKEVPDPYYWQLMQKVRESERNEWKG